MNNTKAQIQAEALARWKMAGKRGLLAMGTGTGKSKVALNRLHELYVTYGDQLRVLLAVPTEKLRDEGWPEEAKKWSMHAEYKQVEGCCYASLKTKPAGHYNLVILDEAHRITPENSQVFDNITYDELLALSATPPSTNEWEKKQILDDVAKTVFTYSLDQGVKDGVAADFRIYVVEVPLDDTKKTIKAGSKAKPFMTTEQKQYDYLSSQLTKLEIQKGELFKKILLGIADAKERKQHDQLEERIKFKRLERSRFIYNSATKQEVAARMMRRVASVGRTLIFAGSIAQAEALCGTNTYHSKRDDTALTAFKAQQIDYLGVVDALDEGHNIDNLDRAIAVQVKSNERGLVQRLGRVVRVRPGHSAEFYIIVASGTVDETWTQKALTSIDPSKIAYISHKNF